MNQVNKIGFHISPEKLAQLDSIAKAMDRDPSQVLNEAVDKYLRSAIPERQGMESTEPMNEGNAGAMAWLSDAEEGRSGVVSPPVQADPDPPVRPVYGGSPMFLDQPVPPRRIEEVRTQPRFPILGPWKTKGRLLIFLSTKGGTGVTTVACNFAVTLAKESGKRVLLIDLNLSRGDVTLNLGLVANHTILNALLNVDRLDSTYLFTLLELHSSGLFVLAAPTELTGENVSREAVCKLLAVAGEEFDYVVVDAGTTLDTMDIYTFDESSIIYVVTQIGISELRNSNRLISRFPKQGGPAIEVVINRFDPKLQEIDENNVTRALTRPARWRIPNDYPAVRRMHNTATPLSGNSPISRTILQMVKCVCGAPSNLDSSKGINLFGWKLSRR